MTVKELKEYLASKDDDLKVLIESSDGEYYACEATKIELNDTNIIITG